MTSPRRVSPERLAVAAAIVHAGPLLALLTGDAPERATPVGARENRRQRLRAYHIVTTTYRAEVLPAAAQTRRFPAVSSGRGAARLLQQREPRVLGAADLEPTTSL
jgi:hypothetical protein